MQTAPNKVTITMSPAQKLVWQVLASAILPMLLFNVAALADEQQDGSQSSPPIPPPSTSTTVVSTHVRLDPRYPAPKIGAAFYPSESTRRHEEGICIVRILVRTDGTIPALQLVSTSGYPRLDGACWNAFVDIKVRPATVNGNAVSSWVNIPITWVLNGSHRTLSSGDYTITPHFSDDYQLGKV